MPRGAAMNDLLDRWKLDERLVRDRMYGAPTARERERWHAVWLVVRGWSAARAAEALERDAHTVGEWLAQFREHRPAAPSFAQTGGVPPPPPRAPQPRGGGRPPWTPPGTGAI